MTLRLVSKEKLEVSHRAMLTTRYAGVKRVDNPIFCEVDNKLEWR